LTQPARQWLAHWWNQRHAPSFKLKLTHRNLYILPTRSGWMLAVTLVLLLVASINDQLNLGYVLTFWLLGIAVVAMHMTHGNARGLDLCAPDTEIKGFAGAPVALPLTVSNPRRSAAWAIGWRLQGEEKWHWNDFGPGQHTLLVAWTPPHRGKHAWPRLRIETRYPLGTFRAWTVWRLPCTVLAYPHPEANAPGWSGAPSTNEDNTHNAPAIQASAGLRDQLRPYRRGDPLRDIAWRKSASAMNNGHMAWISRESVHSGHTPLVFEVAMTRLDDKESQLSRLCAWVLMAEQRGVDYGLRIGNTVLPPSRGDTHQRQCLEALAQC
jgi:uncharacterized protein (DUF58 family)